MTHENPWWRGCLVYQIYPRSFADSNADGVGDLPGITRRLEYVASLGVDAVWLSPFFTSPMRDYGYDVSDYRSVDRLFGDIDDFVALLERAHALGLKVIIDQVLSHTSDEHAWFVESASSADNARHDWYVWADPKADGSPPNNWLSVFGGSAWEWHEGRSQYYLHNFLNSQPDLNFHNEAVRAAHLDNLRFWLDLGVDGFRLDVVNFYFHDAALRDNPPAAAPGDRRNPSAVSANPYFGQRHVHDIDQPENLGFLRELRAVLDQYPERTSVGEISSDDSLGIMSQYTSGDDALHMAYTFDLLNERRDGGYLRRVVTTLEDGIADGWPCWALSNHDVKRSLSRWGGREDAALFPRVSLALLLSLRGSACLYQGEELGLPEAEVPRADLRDPYGIRFWPQYKGRDGCRTPMVWDGSRYAGFSTATPWLPIDAAQRRLAVSVQEHDDDSTLNWLRRFIAWRSEVPALVSGDIEVLADDGEMLRFVRRGAGQSVLVAVNLTSDELAAPLSHPVRSTLHGHGFCGAVERGRIVLPPYQALFALIDDSR